MEKILIIGPNWLGDGVMAMPAIQSYARAFPGSRITMLVKPKMADLWTMHPAIADVWTCPETFNGTTQTIESIRAGNFKTAFILPNSLRSALLPFLGGIPRRIGFRGHWRGFLINNVIERPQDASHHQKHEYAAIFGCALANDELPHLKISRVLIEKARAALLPEKQWIALLPGAARGKAKRWPAEFFSDLGRTLESERGFMVAVFGSDAEKELCARICADIGANALNMAGQTTIPELAAALSCCAAVIGNDSGGVHLAAAAGAPVMAIYGITDPARTGPLGRKVVILQESATRSRDIPRQSAEAEQSLRKIRPQTAAEKLPALIGR